MDSFPSDLAALPQLISQIVAPEPMDHSIDPTWTPSVHSYVNACNNGDIYLKDQPNWPKMQPQSQHMTPSTKIKQHSVVCNKPSLTSTQCKITEWTSHRPFISGIALDKSSCLNNNPMASHQHFNQHLSPSGTTLPVVDHTRII